MVHNPRTLTVELQVSAVQTIINIGNKTAWLLQIFIKNLNLIIYLIKQLQKYQCIHLLKKAAYKINQLMIFFH